MFVKVSEKSGNILFFQKSNYARVCFKVLLHLSCTFDVCSFFCLFKKYTFQCHAWLLCVNMSPILISLVAILADFSSKNNTL